MNQEKIGKTIKEIRTNNKLSQKDFATKYNVTYQAVSKWETGKNIPDLAILKQICNDYNISLEELLEGNKKKKDNKNIIFISTIIVSIIIILILFLLSLNNKDNNFQFKTLSSTTEDFNLKGSIAYNKDKTSIYISDITYNGNDNTEYKEIKSTLYEIEDKIKKEIGTYNKSLLITMKEFAKGMSFHVENHASICKEYTEESLLLEILATDISNKTTKYEISISISDNCHQ